MHVLMLEKNKYRVKHKCIWVHNKSNTQDSMSQWLQLPLISISHVQSVDYCYGLFLFPQCKVLSTVTYHFSFTCTNLLLVSPVHSTVYSYLSFQFQQYKLATTFTSYFDFTSTKYCLQLHLILVSSAHLHCTNIVYGKAALFWCVSNNHYFGSTLEFIKIWPSVQFTLVL